MRTTTRCLLLAVTIGALGLSLRLAVPVAPVDGAFRAVLRAYAAPAPAPESPAGDPSNTAETSPPQ